MISFESADSSDVSFEKDAVRHWLLQIAHEHGKSIVRLAYLFCSDEYMLDKNQTFLGHDFYTDILTFPYNNPAGIEGDVLISLERVYENSIISKTTKEEELRRVILHGLLHLLGHDDQGDEAKKLMRRTEDMYLTRYITP